MSVPRASDQVPPASTARAARRGDIARVAVVLALLAVAAAGLGARERARLVPGGGHPVFLVGAVALVGFVGAATLLGLLAGTARHRVKDDQFHQVRMIPYTRWSRPLALLLVLCTLAVPAVLVVVESRRPVPAPGGGRRLPVTGAALVPLVVLGTVAVAGALVFLTRRWWTNRSDSAAPPGPVDTEWVGSTLRAGERALRQGTGPREAVIGCYAAMERHLTEAGAPPDPADTPEQVLLRALAATAVRPEPVRELTALFREARYSSHPIGERYRQRALDLLAGLRERTGTDR